VNNDTSSFRLIKESPLGDLVKIDGDYYIFYQAHTCADVPLTDKQIEAFYVLCGVGSLGGKVEEE